MSSLNQSLFMEMLYSDWLDLNDQEPGRELTLSQMLALRGIKGASHFQKGRALVHVTKKYMSTTSGHFVVRSAASLVNKGDVFS